MSNLPSSRLSRQVRELSADQHFWQLWRQGRPPELPQFLAAQPTLSPEQAAAVIAIDQYERWLTDQRVSAEEYLKLLPEGEGRDQAACDIIYGEFLLREQLGEHPSLDEYRTRFPGQADLLTRQVELHRALADEQPAAPSTVEPPRTMRGRAPTCIAGPGDLAPLTAPVPRSVPRPDIPGYEIVGEIGRGGMGVVYKARQLSLGRVVALKVVRVQPGSDPDGLTRLRREAWATASLSHPHIVTVHNADVAGSHFYLAMEYVAGTDLHRLVEQRGPLPVALACEYVRQAALGLQHAHEHGLVHRDIKPSNLIVVPPPDGQGAGTVKILDLGLARWRPGAGPASGGEPAPITQDGAFMGTPEFIAPEQANDPRKVDIRSDLYSLGCTFFYLLAGRPPFVGPTPLSKLMQHHLETPPLVETLRPEVPAGVSAVLQRLLAKLPDARYQTPAELARALQPWAASLPAAEQREPDRPEAPPLRTDSVSVRIGVLHKLLGHANRVKSVAFSPDGKLLASASLDRTVRLWDVASGRQRFIFEHPQGVLCLAWLPDGKSLATGSEDRTVRLWDLASAGVRWQGEAHSDLVDCLASSRRGDTLLSGGHDGTLNVWDAATGQVRRSWQAHVGSVWGVALDPAGKVALSGGQDRNLRLWAVETGESLAALPEQATQVNCVAFSPDGRFALTGGTDCVVRLWDVASLRERAQLQGHEGRVTSVAFSPDGRQALSGSRDLSVRVWDLAAGQVREVLSGHSAWVNGVAWSPAGGVAASCSVDRSICVWQLGPA